ncbi:MAG: lytic transglycosylase domain-containing protein [Burkholderiaceae bacterium]
MRSFGPTTRNLKQGFLSAATAVLVAVPALALAQPIYVGSTASGTVVLSSFRSDATPRLLLGGASTGMAEAAGSRDLTAKSKSPLLDRLIDRVATEVSVSSRLLHAVIAVESGYDSRAVSPKGAKGLMQLMPPTAHRFGVIDPFDPEQNVRAGATYLRALLDMFDGDTKLALAAYNAGEGAVIRSGNRVPDFAETQA